MSCVCVFFFFKQKTAYEMRISDWSSDVCSSDLDVGVVVQGRLDLAELDAEAAALDHAIPSTEINEKARLLFAHDVARAVPPPPRGVDVEGLQIGSASCRDSVCKYV